MGKKKEDTKLEELKLKLQIAQAEKEIKEREELEDSIPEAKKKPRLLGRSGKRMKKNKKKNSYIVRILTDDDVKEYIAYSEDTNRIRIDGKSYYITDKGKKYNKMAQMYELEYVEGFTFPLIQECKKEKLERHIVENEVVMNPILTDATLFDKFCDGKYVETIIQAYQKLQDHVKMIVVLLAGSILAPFITFAIQLAMNNGGGV